MNDYSRLLYSNLGRNSKRPAVRCGGETYSYERLCGLVDGFCAFLSGRGVSEGKKVCLFLPNSLELAVSLFSVAKLGAVSVPVDAASGSEEIRRCVEFSKPSLVVTTPPLYGTLDSAVGDAEKVAVTPADFEERGTVPAREISAESPAVYLFSTGSTGKPKCVARTHRNMTALADNHTATMDWDREDRILFSVPVSHTYGLGNFVSAVSVGALCCFLAGFSRKRVLETVEREKTTVFPAVPFMLETLSRSRISAERDLSSLRYVISAGAPLGESTFFSFHGAFGVYPRQLYGSSETGVMTVNLAEDVVEKRLSVGRPVRNVEIRVVSETGETLPAGGEGEVVVRSPSMTDGYVNFPEETARAFRDGFYHTGDVGTFDGDGYLFLRGRKKLFINVSGNKVDPYEVENLLMTHEKITEAAVVGVSGGAGGERVKAFVVADGLSGEDVADFCRGKLSAYKIPSRVEFADRLPKSPAGKVLREKLR